MTLNNFFDNEEWAASISLSNNSEIGVLPPGLISNEEDLFEEISGDSGAQDLPQECNGVIPSGKTIKKDLRVNINYRAVNPYVWYIFYVNYGGVLGAS